MEWTAGPKTKTEQLMRAGGTGKADTQPSIQSVVS